MTDAEIWTAYKKIDPERDDVDEDRPAIVGIVRLCLSAKTHKGAVEVLRRYSWGDPEGAAAELRGRKTCPTCKGEGVV